MIDIVIPCYNETQNLDKLLGMLEDKIQQKSIHVYIADACESEDNAKEIAEKYGAIYHRCKTMGRACQMNEVAAKGESPVIMFLHADVMPPVDFDTQISHAIEEGYQAGFFSYRFDKQSIMLWINSYFTRSDGYFAGGGDQCQFFKRSVFDQLEGFDEAYCLMEDFEMIDRVRNQNISYKVIPSDAIVSARKYETRSWLMVNYINLRTFLKYKKGTSPTELRRFYKSLLREPV